MKISLKKEPPTPTHAYIPPDESILLSNKTDNNYVPWQSKSCHKNISDKCLHFAKLQNNFQTQNIKTFDTNQMNVFPLHLKIILPA